MSKHNNIPVYRSLDWSKYPEAFKKQLLRLNERNQSNLGTTRLNLNANESPLEWNGTADGGYNRLEKTLIDNTFRDPRHPIRLWDNNRDNNRDNNAKRYNTRLGDTEKVGLYDVLRQLQEKSGILREDSIKPLVNIKYSDSPSGEQLQALYEFARDPKAYKDWLASQKHTVDSWSVLPPCKQRADGIGLDCDTFVQNAYPKGSNAYYVMDGEISEATNFAYNSLSEFLEDQRAAAEGEEQNRERGRRFVASASSGDSAAAPTPAEARAAVEAARTIAQQPIERAKIEAKEDGMRKKILKEEDVARKQMDKNEVVQKQVAEEAEERTSIIRDWLHNMPIPIPQSVLDDKSRERNANNKEEKAARQAKKADKETTRKAKIRAKAGYYVDGGSVRVLGDQDDYLDPQIPDFRYEGGYTSPYGSYGNAYDTTGAQSSFNEGGSVGQRELPRLADLIQSYGRNGDTELAHINPIEAQILRSIGGSGTINPATGLREYSFWKKPFKAIKSVLGGGAGAVIGNMIAPGIGGIIGGAIGQGVQHSARGKSALQGALKGAGMGAALPSVASGLGWGANQLGVTGVGSSLSDYGSTNAILPALGMGSSYFGGSVANYSPYSFLSQGMGGGGRGQGVGAGSDGYPQMQYPNYRYVDNRGFMEKLGDNTKDYLSSPANLLTLGTAAAQFAGRQKPKSPEKIAEEERRYRNASRKTIAEVEADEAIEAARSDLERKRKNKQVEEDIKNMGRVNRRSVSPEEFARTGRWLEYTDEAGNPVRMKGGGHYSSPANFLMVEEIDYPRHSARYFSGDTGGQDDMIDARLSDGEYVFDASTVSDLGDGNNAAGAKLLDRFRENIRKHKRGGKIVLPPKAKSLATYLAA